MSAIPTSVLFGALVVLLLLSAFFSSSETGMMALNRYRLRHLVRQNHRGARNAAALLDQPDRLIGLILLGNNAVNIGATTLTAVISLRLFGEAAVAYGALILTFVVLIFAEVAPKTLAAMYPERIAFPAAMIYRPMMTCLYPFVWAVNKVSNFLLNMFGVSARKMDQDALSTEELRTVVREAGVMISKRHQDMLVSILDLEKVTVDDIMVPRNEVNALDLEDHESELLEQIRTSQHTQLPIFRGDINSVEGIVHLRRLIEPLETGALSKEVIKERAKEPYFLPTGTPLNVQLLNFQRREERIGLVVDEYGDVQGLVALEDILEEIVGQFTTDPADVSLDIHPQTDGTYLIDGSANIRELNRAMDWEFPAGGPKTLNGLILEHMEAIPEPGTSLLLAGYPVEIIQTTEHGVKTARINPAKRQVPAGESVHD
ncbi:MAG: HlyC/CorC family transporter [Gammaproteobacteria bacterium]|nr:HlyC/CorC family transporter [Gammaproteobacteria bacterium]